MLLMQHALSLAIAVMYYAKLAVKLFLKEL